MLVGVCSVSSSFEEYTRDTRMEGEKHHLCLWQRCALYFCQLREKESKKKKDEHKTLLTDHAHWSILLLMRRDCSFVCFLCIAGVVW